MNFKTTQEQEELRAKIRAFAETEIKPYTFLWDKENIFPREVVTKMAENGWMGIPFPKEYGGAGLDATSYAIAVEELSRVDGGTGVILSAHVSLGSWPIFAFGTEEQKQKYLVPLAKGRRSVPSASPSPTQAQTLAGTETTAVLQGDHYLLNGEKIFITNWRRGRHLCGLRGNHPGYWHQGHQRLYCGKGMGGLYLWRPL